MDTTIDFRFKQEQDLRKKKTQICLKFGLFFSNGKKDKSRIILSSVDRLIYIYIGIKYIYNIIVRYIYVHKPM